MKLVIAIVPNDDSVVATSALTKEGFFVTKLSTTGGFLMVGNTTLLIGTDEEKVPAIKEILKTHCCGRKQLNPSISSFGRGIADGGLAEETTVGGATMFVLNVESFEKI